MAHADTPNGPAGGVGRGITISTISQLGARALHLVLNVVSSLAILRYLGPRGYGDYLLVTTVTTLLGIVADFGLGKLAVREAARDPDSDGTILASAVTGQLLLSVAAAVGAQVVLLVLGASTTVHAATAVASLAYFGDAVMTLGAVFHLRLEQQYEAVVKVGIEALETAAVLWLISRHAGLVAIVATRAWTLAIGAVVVFVLIRGRLRSRLRLERAVISHLVREAAAFGPAVLLGTLNLKIDVLILAALRSRADVGVYGAAFQPVEYLLLAIAVPINVVFPVLARWHLREAQRHQALYRASTEALVAVLLPAAIALTLAARPLVSLAFGERYDGAVRPLQILGWALVFLTMNGWHSLVLLSGGKQRLTLAVEATSLAACVVLELVLVPRWGPEGAAYATLASSGLAAAWTMAAAHRLVDVRLSAARMARLVGAALVLAAAGGGAMIAGVAWLPALLIAAVAYVIALRLLGMFELTEILDALREQKTDPLPGALS